jgi:hypothetical protein
MNLTDGCFVSAEGLVIAGLLLAANPKVNVLKSMPA